jgi:ankyrin repeat protein
MLQDQETSLHYAARYSQTAIAQKLITAGANVNAQNRVTTRAAFLYHMPYKLSNAYISRVLLCAHTG